MHNAVLFRDMLGNVLPGSLGTTLAAHRHGNTFVVDGADLDDFDIGALAPGAGSDGIRQRAPPRDCRTGP